MAEQTALMLISSDGHAVAPMEEYRPYLERKYLNDFDEFLTEWDRLDGGAYRNHELKALETRLDPEYLAEWSQVMVETGRIDNFGDPHKRLKEMDREGVTAEVLFSDFGLPFETFSALTNSSLSYVENGRYQEYKSAGRRAFNRWLADFILVAPERWAGFASISWRQAPDDIIAEVRQANAAGLKGLTLPVFAREMPLYHPDFEPVWHVIEDLGMVVNTHSGISATSGFAVDDPTFRHVTAPHPAIVMRLLIPEIVFYTQNVLSHLIWGGVLDRHPELKVVLTEQGSYWVVPALKAMDYTYDQSYYRTDYKHVIRSKPSEYFARQCFLGSSIFTQAEIGARHEIGIDKMMIGCDMPHHEGTLIETTRHYLRATLGAENVPVDEARRLLGQTAGEVFGFDVKALEPIASRLNVRPEDVLTPPETDLFARGDAHKPLLLI